MICPLKALVLASPREFGDRNEFFVFPRILVQQPSGGFYRVGAVRPEGKMTTVVKQYNVPFRFAAPAHPF
jgi:hypothetical protein